jgi:cytochrome c-type biogenesis protein CcmH/NrfG
VTEVFIDPDARARLERERDFLIRSLDDLEHERSTGAIDEGSYARLHDDYTARAAAVIRTLGGSGATTPPSPPPTRVSRRRRVLTAAGIAAFGVVVSITLAAALGARLPGETSSGKTGGADRAPSGDDTVSVADRIRRLRAAVAERPDDAASRLLLARFLEADGDLAGALRQYDEVLARTPTSAEAQAQAGRILYLTARAAVRSNPVVVEELVQQARVRLDTAVSIDAAYPDARFFRAIVLANEFGAFAAAQVDLQRYLLLAPDGQFAAQARRLLAEVTAALDGTPLPTTSTTRGTP